MMEEHYSFDIIRLVGSSSNSFEQTGRLVFETKTGPRSHETITLDFPAAIAADLCDRLAYIHASAFVLPREIHLPESYGSNTSWVTAFFCIVAALCVASFFIGRMSIIGA